MFHWEGKGSLKQVSPRSTWLWGHCRWLQPNQAFNFHLTYRAQGENENRASFLFRSTMKLERSASQYIMGLFSFWLWGCDGPPAKGLLIDMDVRREQSQPITVSSSFGQNPTVFMSFNYMEILYRDIWFSVWKWVCETKRYRWRNPILTWPGIIMFPRVSDSAEWQLCLRPCPTQHLIAEFKSQAAGSVVKSLGKKWDLFLVLWENRTRKSWDKTSHQRFPVFSFPLSSLWLLFFFLLWCFFLFPPLSLWMSCVTHNKRALSHN